MKKSSPKRGDQKSKNNKDDYSSTIEELEGRYINEVKKVNAQNIFLEEEKSAVRSRRQFIIEREKAISKRNKAIKRKFQFNDDLKKKFNEYHAAKNDIDRLEYEIDFYKKHTNENKEIDNEELVKEYKSLRNELKKLQARSHFAKEILEKKIPEIFADEVIANQMQDQSQMGESILAIEEDKFDPIVELNQVDELFRANDIRRKALTCRNKLLQEAKINFRPAAVTSKKSSFILQPLPDTLTIDQNDIDSSIQRIARQIQKRKEKLSLYKKETKSIKEKIEKNRVFIENSFTRKSAKISEDRAILQQIEATNVNIAEFTQKVNTGGQQLKAATVKRDRLKRRIQNLIRDWQGNTKRNEEIEKLNNKIKQKTEKVELRQNQLNYRRKQYEERLKSFERTEESILEMESRIDAMEDQNKEYERKINEAQAKVRQLILDTDQIKAKYAAVHKNDGAETLEEAVISTIR